MMTSIRSPWPLILAGIVLLGLGPGTAHAQTSSSEPLVAELSQLMDAAGLESIAVNDPVEEERFVAALYFAGRQLLVVSANYSAPILLEQKIIAGNYRDVYIDLNSASVLESRFFVDDLGVDGLQARPVGDGGADSCDRAGKSLALDGDWDRQQMSEEDYNKAFAEADGDFAEILTLLIAQVRQVS